MRRWLSARATGAVLALMLVVASVSTAAAADPRDFTLINNTGTTIDYVYVSSSLSSEWGEDVLGQDVLEADRTVDILFPGGRLKAEDCVFDIKVVTDTGAEGLLTEVHLGSTRTVTFS